MTGFEIAGIACAVVAYGYFAVLSVVLAIVDARTHRLPDRYVLPAYPIVAALLTAAALLTGSAGRLVWVLVGGEWVLVGAVLGFVLGGLYAIVLLATRRAGASTSIAFGPFLLAGAWGALAAAVVLP